MHRIFVIMALGLLAACQGPPTATSQQPPDAQWVAGVGSNRIQGREEIIGRSVEGRPIKAVSFGFGRDVVLIIASIHGDEPAGTPLAERLMNHLEHHPHLVTNRKVVVIAMANPDGLVRHSRENANGVDLNRNFPSSNRTNLPGHGLSGSSEPESEAIKSLMARIRPNRIVSIHQPLSCVDYDGPALDLARAMANVSDLKIRKLGARPGSLGSYAGVDHSIPIVTLELPGGVQRLRDSELWARYGPMLLAAIEYRS